MSRLTPEEFAARLRAQAELGAEIKRQARVVETSVLPPEGPPAEKRTPPKPPGSVG